MQKEIALQLPIDLGKSWPWNTPGTNKSAAAHLQAVLNDPTQDIHTVPHAKDLGSTMSYNGSLWMQPITGRASIGVANSALWGP